MNSLKELKTIRQRTSTVPKVTTPKAKVQKSVQMSGNMSQSTKKPISKRRLLPAHAGVPITEKMKESIRRGFAEMKPLTEVPVTKPQTEVPVPKQHTEVPVTKPHTEVPVIKPQTASAAPKITTPKSKVHKTVLTAASSSQSSKKVISKRRPIPAHSGVPITEKMKELLKKDFVEKNPPIEVRSTRQRASLAPTRERTNTAPKDVSNTKQKGSENVPPSAKKSWKVPAHYGVPITEKMKQSLRRGFIA